MLSERARFASDPRAALSANDLRFACQRARPDVAHPSAGSDKLVIVAGVGVAMLLGLLTLTHLSDAREKTLSDTAVELVPVVTTVAPRESSAAPVQLADSAATAGAAEVDAAQSRAMPMIIDNTTAGASAPSTEPPKKDAPAAAPAGLTADEMFAQRAGGSDSVPGARAVSLSDPAHTVSQGTLIAAVLETALNSDLPGFARAIVSRDVPGFDGSRVLIPRGSRLIGQYKSGLATGQSRAFVIWTRLIRPDGVSVQLGSPALDERGEVGLTGDVERHFWQRYGSSMLLSVIAGAASAIGDGSTSVVIGSSGAQSAAAAALESDSKIAPTVRVPLGTPIQVFTARDLDFAAVDDNSGAR